MTIPKETTKPDMLRLAVAAVLEADREFRANMPPEWEGDPLSDEIDGLRRVFSSTLPIAGEGKALDEEQIAKLIWQHLPSKVAEEMTRDKHPPLFPQAEYTVATLSAKNFVEAIIDLAAPSSPGKDGGQEVEAVAWLTQCIDNPNLFELVEPKEVITNLKHWTDAFPVYRRPQPSPQSTVDAEAVIERLTKALAGFAEAAKGLKRIVEEIDGTMNHGTWRDDHGNRLKDTPEWVALYSALAALAKSPSSDRAASEGWQPIETARISNGSDPFLAHITGHGCSVCYKGAGSFIYSVSSGQRIHRATHWRPLPAPPASAEAKGSGQ